MAYNKGMEILPGDLGPHWRTAVFRYRTFGTARIHTPPHIGALGRIWAAGLDLPETVTAATLPMMADAATPLVVLPGVAAPLSFIAVCYLTGFRPDAVLIAGLIAASLLYFFVIHEPRRRFRALHQKPLTGSEIVGLKGGMRGRTDEKQRAAPRGKLAKTFQSVRGVKPLQPAAPLDHEFLSLIQDALITQNLPPAAEREIRRLLPFLGETTAVLALWRQSDENAEALPTMENEIARDNLRRLMRRAATFEEDFRRQLSLLRSLLPMLATESAASATDYNRFAALTATLQNLTEQIASLSETRDELTLTLHPRSAPTETQKSGRLT